MRIVIGALLTAIFISSVFFLLSERTVNPSIILIAAVTGIGLIIILISSIRTSGGSRTEEREFFIDTMRQLVTQLKDRHVELDIFNENILQSVPSGVMSINNEGIVTKINDAGKKILKREDIQGKPVSDVVGEPLLRYILEKDSVKREEVLCDISGKNVWLGFSISPLFDRNKNIIGKIITFTDITEVKELQSRIKLRERLEGLGEMAAGIAHELRNPMAVITGYANMLKKKADPTIQGIVESIQKEISLMDNIIRDFLSFARYEEPNLVSINPERVIREVIESLNISPEIELSVYIEPSDGLMVDETLIRQALRNLIQNSLDAMPEGGKLSIKGEHKDGFYRISISDTGKGIAPEIREKIFLPFFTTKERGTGLGLAIVHKVITAHGGEITFNTSEKGTTFMISLPIRTPDF
ncbi:MAG: ATP-binding protein [Thermodesulfovibrionales bacterium]|nr:ATP-binding protein [Thermodesulfovibrionales bacterium]